MNDEVKIDNSFKLSFMTDITKGMEYLHKSHMHSHGNLKSSNCLVDGRWTVRVSNPHPPQLMTIFVMDGAALVRACEINQRFGVFGE